MRKAIFMLITTVATTAAVAVGTSAFAVAIAPPDVHGQVQDLPSIISGSWEPVEFDVTSTATGSPVVLAGPAAEPIGQQATEEQTTDTSDEEQSDGTGDSDAEAPADGTPDAPGGGSSEDAQAEKDKKEKKDKAEKEKKEKADKEKKDKADKEKKDKKDKKGESDDEEVDE